MVIVSPPESNHPALVNVNQGQVNEGRHLRVQVGVAQDQLLVLKVEGVLRELSPSLSLRPYSSLVQLVFVHGQLGEEGGSHFQVGSSGVEELEGLQQTPPVLPHDKRCNHKARSVLRLHRLHQNRLLVFQGFFHEFVDFIWYLLLGIEKSLFLVVLPVESQVEHSDWLPVVGQLGPRSVHHSTHFVRYHEFQVL